MHRRLVATLCLLLPAAGGAQGASETARAFLNAHSTSQWADMARFVDSSSMAVVRAEAVRMLRGLDAVQNSQSSGNDTGATAGFRRMLEGMKSLTGDNMLAMYFANVRTEQEMNALSDRELMARWFEAKSPAYLRQMSAGTMRAMLGSLQPEAREAAEAAMASSMPTMPTWDVVGEVREPGAASHVIYRVAGKTPLSTTSVLTFRPEKDGKWYLTFSGTDDQLASMAGMTLRAMMPSLSGR